jgi:glycogen operon protein
VQELRDRQRRNLMATLLVSQGVPMLLAGDEIGRTQRGNNNAYAQDNDISFLDWDRVDTAFLDFCRRLIGCRRANPVLRRSYFLTGIPDVDGLPDAAWFTPEGDRMSWEHWGDHLRHVVVWLNGELEERGPRGEQVRGSTVLMAINAQDEPMPMRLPGPAWGRRWRVLVDTTEASGVPVGSPQLGADQSIVVAARSLVLLERIDSEG